MKILFMNDTPGNTCNLLSHTFCTNANIKRSCLLVFIICFITAGNAWAQQAKLSGKVVVKGNETGLSGARVAVFGQTHIEQNQQETDSQGRFEFNLKLLEWYHVFVSYPGYKTYSEQIYLDKNNMEITLTLDNTTEHLVSAPSITNQDTQHVTFGHIGFGSQFYSPNLGAFQSAYTFDYVFGMNWKINKHDEFGLDIQSMQLSWSNLNHDTLLTSQVYSKEQYFGVFMGLWAYNRLVFTRPSKKPWRYGLFLDAGAGYLLPLYYSYSYKEDEHTQTNVRRIHKNNEFNAMVRLGYDFVAIKATYRLTDILINPYPEPPRLKMGIELLIPLTDNY